MNILLDALKRLEGSRLEALGIGSPMTIPSGIVTTSPRTIALIAELVPEIGFITTKTISVEPRAGYREPILYEYAPGCFSNAVGLANPGARSFLDEMRRLIPLFQDKPLFVSIMGSEPRDFLECGLMLETIADAFELNMSCPHVSAVGQTVGSDPEMVAEVVGLLKERLQKPIIPKLSPNIPNLVEIAQVCEDNGADALCLINTVGPGVATDMEGAPALTNVSGGLSGAGIFPLGLKAVRDVSQRAQIPIIACGGISGPAQIRAYYEAGAALFGVGSALAGLNTSEIVEFFKDISNDLQSEQESGIQVKLSPKTGLTNYFKTRVLETRSFGEGLFEIKLEDGPECKPGQFFFLRRPGIGEKPFSPAEDQPPLYLVRVVGQFTEALSKLRPGDAVFLRGPYGNGFPEPQSDRRLLLIGGGTGVAPLMMAAAKYRGDVKMSYAGFSSPVDRPFRYDLAGRLPYCKLIVDPPKELGAMAHGLARDMENDPGEFYKIQAFLSGPKPMVDQVASLLKKELTDPLIHVAREDIMRCGIGLCGSCATEDGRRSCVDGPVTAPYTE